MKVKHISYSDLRGGAAIGAFRMHTGLLNQEVDSQLWVNWATSGLNSVKGPGSNAKTALSIARRPFGELLAKGLKTKNPSLHSPNFLPSSWPKKIGSSDADVVHLHWMGWEMLSVNDVAQIQKPLVWSVDDMWPFCGAEHYTEDFRWQQGYLKNNRPEYESGWDLNRWVWERKVKSWRRPVHMIAPSQWVADCIKSSVLMHDWPVTVMPYPLDTKIWAPVDKSLAKQLMGLPQGKHYVGFGAINGGKDPRKGIALLKESLAILRHQFSGDIELIVFGEHAPVQPEDLGYPVHYLGHLHDDMSLRVMYSAFDVMVVPSRQETFGQTASEALSCGTPVVCFGATGLLDVVKHQVTGWHATPYEPEDLAKGIAWVLEDGSRYERLCLQARIDAVDRFDMSVVIPQLKNIYKQAIEGGA